MPMKCIDQIPPPRAKAPTQRHSSRPRGLLLRLRFELDQYVNLRPSTLYAGAPGPLAAPFGLERFAEGRFIDESVAAGVAH